MADRYAHLRQFYAEFARYKDNARRVAWRCYEGQIVRLQVLLEVIRKEDHPVSILDVGCGVGTLYGYLRDTDRLGDYLGIDLLPDMVQQARTTYPEGLFEVTDLLETSTKKQFDLVVCSGSLNVLVDHHEHWLHRMLAAMWERAKMAVAVNVQTTRAYRFNPASKSDPDLYHAKVPMFLQWCEELTPWVALRQDYLGSDAAFYLYKEYHRSGNQLRDNRRHDSRNDWERACGLAFLLLERKLPRQALAVLEGFEGISDVYNYRGLCYHRMGDHRKARKNYESALEIDPHHPDARLNLDWIIKR